MNEGDVGSVEVVEGKEPYVAGIGMVHEEGAYPRVHSASLFGGSPCVVIVHGREEYRLRITRLGKLILTK